ncbi:MAG: hypothetical protein ACE37N_14405 [Pseudohongiellaceae bacterium]
MTQRGGQLAQFQFQMPVFDALFFASLMRWAMMLIVIAAVMWGMYELFRRFALIERFNFFDLVEKKQGT